MANVDVPTYPSEDAPGYIKPGWASSEFYVALFSQAIAMVSFFAPQLGEHLASWTQPLATVAAIAGTSFYVLSRSHVKAAAHKAVGQVAAARAAAGPAVTFAGLEGDAPQGPALSQGDAAFVQ